MKEKIDLSALFKSDEDAKKELNMYLNDLSEKDIDKQKARELLKSLGRTDKEIDDFLNRE